MTRLVWLVGPPGAGKSTFARTLEPSMHVVEFDAMLGPLVSEQGIRKGILSANSHLLEVVREIVHHPDNTRFRPVLVVAGLVQAHALFPLREGESVMLLLPNRERWSLQLRQRPVLTEHGRQYDDYTYAEHWYERFEEWLKADFPVQRIENIFDSNLIGKVSH